MTVPAIYLNKLLADTAKKGASSLHLSVGSSPIMRISGSLVLLEEEDVITVDLIEEIIKSFVVDEDFKKLQKEKKLILVKNFAGDFRFRVNIFHQRNTPSISFNYISGVIRSLSDLNLSSQITDSMRLNSGLLILAGPDNSGKTNTAAAFIEEINKNKKHYIITLENPIEYVFINKKSVIEQREIGHDAVSYFDGLEHCLNEDVDVVYIDEMKKDFEKAAPLILDLASGNALVILEINAENSIRAIEKMISAMSKEGAGEAVRHNLADVLIGIVSHKLIPGRGGDVVLAKEVLVSTSPIKALIREGKIYQIENTLQISKRDGMISLEKSIQELIENEKITKEEANKFKI